MPNFNFNLASEAQLTVEQNAAFQSKHPVLITGGPGTGKTVVSIYRFLSSLLLSKNAIFFTYNRTLTASIRGLLIQRGDELLLEIKANEREKLIEESINSIFEWYYANTYGIFQNDNETSIDSNLRTFISNKRTNLKFDQVIVDEAQDLPPRIIKSLSNISDQISCGADSNQDLQGNWPAGSANIQIGKILNSFRYTEPRELRRNFRNTKQIFAFARKFSSDPRVLTQNIAVLPDGEIPEIFSGLDDTLQLRKIWEIVEGNQSNIGIIVFGKEDIKKIRDFLRNEKKFFDFSYYFKGMPHEDRLEMERTLKTPFIITYESCKGLEFDIVIQAFFEKADWALTKAKTDNENNPQHNADGSVKMICTKNHYYVAATRARKQLYVFHNQEVILFRGFTNVAYKLNNILQNA